MDRNTNPTNPDVRGAYLLSSSKLASSRSLLASERVGLLIAGVGLAVVLAIASWLSPSPQGYGTHRQLGLPDCTMVAIFGTRCPGCGMTTSWAHTMRGDWEAALGANIGGTMLCILSMFCAPCLIGLGLSGRSSRGGWFSMFSLSVFCAALGVSIVEWLIRLAAGS